MKVELTQQDIKEALKLLIEKRFGEGKEVILESINKSKKTKEYKAVVQIYESEQSSED